MGKKSRRRPAAPKAVPQQQQVENHESNDEINVEHYLSSAPPPAERPPSIHELDDLKAAFKWMLKGRVDTKGFAKYLPHTSQALQEGKVTPQEVASDLEQVYTVKTCSLAGHEMTPHMELATLCAVSAFPDDFFHSRKHMVDTSFPFSKDLQSKFTERCNAEGNEENISLLLKECVDEACEKWAPRLDRELFRGKKGTFLKRCPLYGITPQEYHHENMPLSRYLNNVADFYEHNKRHVSEMRKASILDAARNVAIGSHDISRKCWECKTVCQDLRKCGKCEAAQYCSKECQRSAWNKGHKQKCKLLKCRYAELDNSLKAMDEYHKSGSDNNFTKNGFSLSDEIDFHILDITFTAGLPIGGRDETIKLGLPSMRQYYENLERVALGEIWFFPNASEESYREAGLDFESESGYVESESDYYFMALGGVLCYDYDLVMNHGFVQKVSDEMFGGVEMPASIFIDIYFRRGRKNQDPADRFRLRRETKRRVLQFFMDYNHT